MKTEKLYYSNQMLQKFNACVLSCEKSGGNFAVILDKTAFFPEEGGQYSDTGVIDGVRVFDVRENDGIITHFTDCEVKVGKIVTCELDFEARYTKMQCHSGEHVVSGIVSRLYGFNNSGFHLGHDDVTLDFDGVLDEDALLRVEGLANRAVWDNLEICTSFPTPQELKALEYRSKLELTSDVRIVTIDGIDVCACCAPHVARTGEIGLIKLFDMIHYKGGVRIHMHCGLKALEDYKDRYKKCRQISNLLSVKQSLVAEGVKRLLDERDALKAELAGVKRRLLEEKIALLEKQDENIVVFENVLGIEHMREYAKEACKYTNGVCAVFCKKSEGEYSFVLTAITSAKPVFDKLKESFACRGGGSETMLSGVISAGKDEILSLLLA